MQNTLIGKMLIGTIGVVLVGGILIAVVVPFFLATAKAELENTSTTGKKITFLIL